MDTAPFHVNDAAVARQSYGRGFVVKRVQSMNQILSPETFLRGKHAAQSKATIFSFLKRSLK